MKDTALDEGVHNVVVIGGGYIGIEVAETLMSVGKQVRVIEFADQILRSFDSEITEIAREHLIQKGVKLHLAEKMEEIADDGNGNVSGVKTNKGYYEADMVVLALGIRPATEFLKSSGIRLFTNGAVVTDREMRTSIPDIYAAGDCAMVYNLIEQDYVYIALGTTANKCGRIAGDNILGGHTKYIGTLGSAAIKIGDMEAARTGMSEETVKEHNIPYAVSFIKAADHAAYFPNPTPIWMKLICEKNTGKMLGAQAIGYKGAVLRIDVMAAAITSGMTAAETGMTDFCYAPPFAGVWDVMNIAANAVK